MWLFGLTERDLTPAAVELTDRMVEKGLGDHTALIGNGRLIGRLTGVTVGSTGEQTATFSTITLQPGRYCTTLVSDGAPALNFLVGPSFAGIAAVNSYLAVLEFSCPMTYGAFPTPWNIPLTANYNVGGGRWAVRLVP